MTRRSGKTAAEYLRARNTDPMYLARKREQDEKVRLMEAELAAAEAPLVTALQTAGLAWVRSVWDLVNTREPYPHVLDLLIEHLQGEYPSRVQEGIGRALAVPESRRFWSTLLRLFRHHPDGGIVNQGKFGIGCALAAGFTEDRLGDVIAILDDPRHGGNRAVFLPVIARLKSSDATAALERAAEDPDLEKEAKFQLRLKARRDRKSKS
jgi:hypothetical protein